MKQVMADERNCRHAGHAVRLARHTVEMLQSWLSANSGSVALGARRLG